MKRKELRIVPLMLAVVLVVSLVGCGKGKDADVPTKGDWSYQVSQYGFTGIPEDQSLTNEDSSDTDSTGRVYNNGSFGGGSYGGSYGGGSYNNPGYVRPPVNGGGSGNGSYGGSGSNSGGSNNGKVYMTVSEILRIVGDVKTYEQAIAILESKGIHLDQAAQYLLDLYYKSKDDTKANAIVSDIFGKVTEAISNRPTKAPTTVPAQ